MTPACALEMRTELQRVQRETGITMVFVTHDQAEALALADRIVLMKDGKVEQLGTPEDLYARPQTAFTADFMGFENIFKVEGSTLSSETGQLAMAAPSDASLLAWRPNAVRVGEGPYEGSVLGSSFAGDCREYVIGCPLGQVKAEAPVSMASLDVGDSVAFDLPLDTARSLAG